jgi:thiol:disulfide interchange protein/DsbC/DsbD-like thiol-disulfide interchange protein
MSRRIFAIFLPFILFLTLCFPAQAQNTEKHVEIRLHPEKTNVKGGDKITVGIEQVIDSGWHTYWLNPGDSGAAPRIEWVGLKGLEASSFQWPIPKRLPMGPLVNFGYEGKIMLLQELTLPEKLPEGVIELTGKIEILVCHEICLPENHQIKLTLNGGQFENSAILDKARAAMPLDTGWATTIEEEKGDLIVTINTDTPNAFARIETIELYPEEWGLIDNTAPTRAEIKGDSLVLRHKRGDRPLAETPPVSRLVVAYKDTAGQRKAVRVSTLESPVIENVKTGDTTLWTAVFFALLGGLVLNLMPCVFPVLSIKALSLAELRDSDIAKARLNGMSYTAGVLISFGAIAGTLIAVKAAGAQVGWGFQLQHPLVILFLAHLFFLIGLNLAGYFEISPRFMGYGQTLANKEGAAGSFFTGVLATLVATPCTAPFMGTAIGYALTQSWYAALLVFLALGFGLAFPYLLLTFFPAFRHVLPKPGDWMEKFRQFLAFPMFASVCWLLWVLAQQVSHMSQLVAMLGLLTVAFGLWLWKSRPKAGTAHFLMTVLAAASFLFAASTFLTVKHLDKSETHIAAKEDSADNWEDFTRAKLEKYLEGDRAVFVNMTAAWCITCKVNEKVALLTDSTRRLFADKNVVYLKGDWTNQNPEITNYLEEYGRSGVPLYVYYGPRDKATGARPDAVVLPQILTPSIIENVIQPKGD